MTIDADARRARALLLLRLSIAVFMLIWALEKFVAPEVAGRVASHYYGVELGLAAVWLQGAAQLALTLAFAAGAFRTWTYGAMTLIHAVSVVVSAAALFDPFSPPNHLFWAGVPTLAAMAALFMMRVEDRLLSLDAARAARGGRAIAGGPAA